MYNAVFTQKMRCAIENINHARVELESRFSGLPHAHTTLIKSLISRADPETGLVEGLNYRDLADILVVDHAPGRRGCGTPQKQTIRSYLRTIEENCGEDFRLISFGQKIKFHFLQMPKIYAYFFAQNELYTDTTDDVKPSNILDPYETFNTVDVIPEPEKSINFPGEAEFENAAKKVLLINKTNKLTGEGDNKFFTAKQPIAQNFYPNAETIAEALSRGFTSVIEPKELTAFIRHNQQSQTQWADFNPVYLTWLERASEYQQRKQATAQLRSKSYGYFGNQTRHQTELERVTQQNRDAIAPSGEPYGYAIDVGTCHQPTYCVGIPSADELISAALREQEWRERQRNVA